MPLNLGFSAAVFSRVSEVLSTQDQERAARRPQSSSVAHRFFLVTCLPLSVLTVIWIIEPFGATLFGQDRLGPYGTSGLGYIGLLYFFSLYPAAVGTLQERVLAAIRRGRAILGVRLLYLFVFLTALLGIVRIGSSLPSLDATALAVLLAAHVTLPTSSGSAPAPRSASARTGAGRASSSAFSPGLPQRH